jgi:regulatory protein
MVEEIRLSSSIDPSGDRRTTPSALDFALARLARRAHSEGELAAKMERAGYAASDIEKALGRLREWRYVDDSLFAANFARSAVERKNWGPERVRRALRKLGLGDEEIRKALSTAFPDGERAPLRQALERFRSRDHRERTPAERKARAYRHLLARGFSPGETMEALREEDTTEDIDSS